MGELTSNHPSTSLPNAPVLICYFLALLFKYRTLILNVYIDAINCMNCTLITGELSTGF
jgi:hypothetical protein